MSSHPNPYSSRRDSDKDRDRDHRPHPSTSSAHAMGHSTRETQDPRASDIKLDNAKADLASLHRDLWDLMAERGRLFTKKETEEKQSRSKEKDYNNMAGNSQFPAVEESYRRHMDAHKKAIEAIEKELAKVDQKINKVMNNYLERVIKAVPLSEIKYRLVADSVKKEFAHQKPAPDNHVEKLEEQLASLVATQKSQADDLDKFKKENDELRALNASYEVQAAQLATLKTQCDQIQALVDAQNSRERELVTQEQKRNELAIEVSTLRIELASLRESVESRKDELQKSLDEAKLQNSHAIPADAASKQELVILKERVDAHEKQLSVFDKDEYTEAVEKLVGYPLWDDLSPRLDKHDKDIQGLRNSVASANNIREDMDKRFKTSDEQFEKFSNVIVETCARMIDGIKKKIQAVEDRLQGLEARAPLASRAASVAGVVPPSPQLPSASRVIEDASLLELKKHVATLRDEIKVVAEEVGVLRRQADETRTAHELMIHSLDSQFKNMTTVEMAQIILDNIKRLPQNTISLDMQNFHERLASLEEAQQEEARTRPIFQAIEESMDREMREIRNARSNGSMVREQFVPRKRQRTLESNGIENDPVGD